MLPFEVETVVLCDDIRQERNGKHLLIGVYGDNIIVGGFPTDLQLSVWMLARAKKKGAWQVRLRLKGPNEAVLVEAQIGLEVKEIGPLTLALQKLPVQLQSRGTMTVELAPIDANEWEQVKSIELKLRAPGASPAS